MTEESISRLVNRIRGMFPAIGVPKDTIIDTWSQDKRLRSVELTPEQKDQLLYEIEKLDGWPTLAQLRAFINVVTEGPQPANLHKCDICCNTGWDTGLRLSKDINDLGNRLAHRIESELNTTTFVDRTYTQVLPCQCTEGRNRAARLATLSRK